MVSCASSSSLHSRCCCTSTIIVLGKHLGKLGIVGGCVDVEGNTGCPVGAPSHDGLRVAPTAAAAAAVVLPAPKEIFVTFAACWKIGKTRSEKTRRADVASIFSSSDKISAFTS